MSDASRGVGSLGRIGLAAFLALLMGGCASLLPPRRVEASAYEPLPSGIVLVHKQNFGPNGAGREVDTLYLVLRVAGAANGQAALDRVKQHFQGRTAGLHPMKFLLVEGYSGKGKKGFSSVTIGLLDQYLADDRSLDLGIVGTLQTVARREPGQLVLVQLDPSPPAGGVAAWGPGHPGRFRR